MFGCLHSVLIYLLAICSHQNPIDDGSAGGHFLISCWGNFAVYPAKCLGADGDEEPVLSIWVLQITQPEMLPSTANSPSPLTFHIGAEEIGFGWGEKFFFLSTLN